MKIKQILQSLILAATLNAASSAQQQKFTTLVLDALDGKPQAGVDIHYFCEGKGYSSNNIVRTGNDGKAEIPYICEANVRIEISANVPNEKKEECGGLGAKTIDEILTHGFISTPTAAGGIWCPTKQSRKLKPVPGQITIFVKKPTWWQSHVAG